MERWNGSIRSSIQPMNIRTNPQLKELRPGEMIHSKLPYHRLQKVVDVLATDGFKFRLDPSPTGYFIFCETAPRESSNAA